MLEPQTVMKSGGSMILAVIGLIIETQTVMKNGMSMILTVMKFQIPIKTTHELLQRIRKTKGI